MTSRKRDKEYHTPTEIGKKWQIDVKYVPKECKVVGIIIDTRTIITKLKNYVY